MAFRQRSMRQHDGNEQRQQQQPQEEVIEDPNQTYLFHRPSQTHHITVQHVEGLPPAAEASEMMEEGHHRHSLQHRHGDEPSAWHHVNAQQPHSAPLLGRESNPSSESHQPLVATAGAPGMSPPRPPHSHAMQPDASHQSVFEMAHGSKRRDESKPHVHDVGDQVPIRLGHLFKRPIIRQWLYKGQLYRECEERAPARFELFFDLVFVGVIHVLADSALEPISSWNIIKFILIFFPAWSIWCDVRDYLNVSGSDDVFQRIYLLIIMGLLTGYAANATAIKIGYNAIGEAGAESGVIDGAAEGTAEHARRLVAFAARSAAPLVSRAAEAAAGHGEEEELKLVENILDGYAFAEGYDRAIKAAVIFYLLAKVARLLLYFVYGLVLPKFRKSLWVNGFLLVLIAGVYTPLVWVHTPGAIFILLLCGMALELFKPYVVAVSLQFLHGRDKHKGNHTFIPALSLEHLMERCTLFVVLVVGESIINSSYTATLDQIGARDEYWRAALGITCSFNIVWLYFDADASRTFVHALRRHWVHSTTWTHLHFPLCAALILLSAALHKMVASKKTEHRYIWIYSGSLGVIMVVLGLLGGLHGSLDRHRSALISHRWRVAQRFFLAAAFGALPLYKGWSTVGFLGTCAGLLSVQTATETFGKIGAVGRYYDDERTTALREQRAAQALAAKGDSSFELGSATQGSASPNNGSTLKHTRANSTLDAGMRKFDKHYAVRGPTKRDSWHEWSDLTGEERGEEDVGVESEIGKLETRYVESSQRFAYAAT